MCISPVYAEQKKYIRTAKSGNKYIDTEMYRGRISDAYNPKACFPCGKCFECKTQKIEEWQIRWKEQLKTSVQGSSYLLTLTYNDENLPQIIYPDGSQYSTLYYSDVTKFLKRLRKRQDTICKKMHIENPKITYHGCGEYGSRNTKRPHYHVLITNLIIPPNEFQKIWGHGTVHIGDNVTDQTIKYCLKYTLKHSLTGQDKTKIYDTDVTVIESPAFAGYRSAQQLFIAFDTDPEAIPHNPCISYEVKKQNYICTIIKPGHKNAYRIAEKTFCSKHIGADYLTPEIIDFYIQNPMANYAYHDVKKNIWKSRPLPRYYREKIFNPQIKTPGGKYLRDEYNRTVPVYNPLAADYENTPRFQRQLISWKNQQKKLLDVCILINTFGYENYISMQAHKKYEKTYSFRNQQTIYNARLTHNAKIYDYD